MPQHRQFKKSLKVNEKARKKNIVAKSHLKTMIKKVEAAKSKDEAEEAFRTAASVIDSTARKRIIKKKSAARKKSQLHKLIAKKK